jgi:hypothetical protein
MKFQTYQREKYILCVAAAQIYYPNFQAERAIKYFRNSCNKSFFNVANGMELLAFIFVKSSIKSFIFICRKI